jgi:L-lactate dehydrogenase complex protein LldG
MAFNVMQESTPREKILKKIRNALIHKTNQPFSNVDWEKSPYRLSQDSLEEMFAKAFTKVGGQFIFCESELEALENIISLAEEKGWKNFFCWDQKITGLMDECAFPYHAREDHNFEEGMVGITGCEALVARLGSVMVSSRQDSGRRLVAIPTTHIVMAYASQLVMELKDALQLIRAKYQDQLPSQIAAITGPSRTADIEKTLVTGAHGPREIFVFLIDDSIQS